MYQTGLYHAWFSVVGMIELEKLQKEYAKLTDELQDPELISNWEKFQNISQKRAQLEKIIKKADELTETNKRLEENKQISLSKEDAELSSLAEQEISTLQERAVKLEKELKNLIEGKDTKLPAALILEIRPGTGGEEASLFARNLFDMYSKFAEKKKWKVTILNFNDTEIGGIREVAMRIKGKDAFKLLWNEAGVHRVQRIPATEKAGRVHTSTASVAVLAEPEKAQIQLKPDDLKIDTFRSSGKGGQNVNKRETAIRITHLPTGIVVGSQTQRSQAQNKENAMNLLAARVLERQQEKLSAGTAQERKAQIGKAERAEKIRTYNFPQDRITDHRISKSWHGIDNILQGNLDDIVTILQENLN